MLKEIGSVDRIPEYIKRAKDVSDPFRLMGFGYRVYKTHDPRAKTCKCGVKPEQKIFFHRFVRFLPPRRNGHSKSFEANVCFTPKNGLRRARSKGSALCQFRTTAPIERLEAESLACRARFRPACGLVA